MEEEGWRASGVPPRSERGERKNVFAGSPKIGSLLFFVDAWAMYSFYGEVGEQYTDQSTSRRALPWVAGFRFLWDTAGPHLTAPCCSIFKLGDDGGANLQEHG